MYFWTNTPNQTAFITAAADVNRYRAYIADPSTSEGDAEGYGALLIEASNQMQAAFDQILPEWYAWLSANGLANPKMTKSGVIHVITVAIPEEEMNLREGESQTLANGETYYWEDFYRVIALIAFFGRVHPRGKLGAYHPESHFHE